LLRRFAHWRKKALRRLIVDLMRALVALKKRDCAL
jgi:hypothetical protein